ncbi:MAG TPA: SDR family oxidoreductase [Bryobacteraceae bacterium]|nr:SDR family oxidoreductase [Bryobacteraceae bacterium]
MSINRPVALITGASSGIGAEFARQLARNGYDLVLVARRGDKLGEVASSLRDAAVELLVADLTDENDVRRIAERLRAEPAISLLVNNAGFGTLHRFFRTDLNGQVAMHRLHVMATMTLTHAALQQMVPRGEGAVINVSSVAAFGVSPGNVSYCATKTWMNTFTEGLWLELQSIGSPVKVQALCPGFTVSGFHDTLGMDKTRIPASFWTSADAVVQASLRGLKQGELFVIPGWRYKILIWLSRVAPRRLRHAVMLRSASRFRKEKAAGTSGN